MSGEIALCVGAVTFAVLVGWLIPLLIQLRKSVAELERLLAVLNIEVPLLFQEIRVATENMNSLIEHTRGGVEHAAGTLGDTVQRVHETLLGTNRSFLVNLAGILAGFRATAGAVKAHIHREGGTNNGK